MRLRAPTRGEAAHDQLSDSTDSEARQLRSGLGLVGVHPYGSPGDGGRRLWTWGCRCGAWLDAGDIWGRAEARRQYRDHKARCPLVLGLKWHGDRWGRSV